MPSSGAMTPPSDFLELSGQDAPSDAPSPTIASNEISLCAQPVTSNVSASLLSRLEEVFAGLHPIPLASFERKSQWDAFVSTPLFQETIAHDQGIVSIHAREEAWFLPGYSSPAHHIVDFIVDSACGRATSDGRFIPNLRERLACPITGLNNRQRLIAALASVKLDASREPLSLYVMEQVTPLFRWFRDKQSRHTVVGSEYLGPDIPPGHTVDGLRHEDVENLSFPDASFDLVLSNDVLEHVPSPRRAFAEIARVLKPGASALLTFPFDTGPDHSVTRARRINSVDEHILPPVFHGNPLSPEGSLVYTDYGWSVLDLIRDTGFTAAKAQFHHAPLFGHLGQKNFVFQITK